MQTNIDTLKDIFTPDLAGLGLCLRRGANPEAAELAEDLIRFENAIRAGRTRQVDAVD